MIFVPVTLRTATLALEDESVLWLSNIINYKAAGTPNFNILI